MTLEGGAEGDDLLWLAIVMVIGLVLFTIFGWPIVVDHLKGG